jgi:RNA polymerase sigma-70 factor (ECF subfamily)
MSSAEERKHAAFLAAYDKCHEGFVRYCTALGYGKMDTEDLVQDVLLSAYHHFDEVREIDQLLHYLVRAARNRAVSRLRRRKYVPEVLERHADRLLAKGVSADQLVEVDLVYRAIDRLPVRQREALLLFEVSGFSIKEIAALQGSTSGAVKTKISRGREKVRRLLTDPASQKSTSSSTPIWALAKLLVL